MTSRCYLLLKGNSQQEPSSIRNLDSLRQLLRTACHKTSKLADLHVAAVGQDAAACNHATCQVSGHPLRKKLASVQGPPLKEIQIDEATFPAVDVNLVVLHLDLALLYQETLLARRCWLYHLNMQSNDNWILVARALAQSPQANIPEGRPGEQPWTWLETRPCSCEPVDHWPPEILHYSGFTLVAKLYWEWVWGS